MLDRLIDFIMNTVDAFRFWQVIQPYERAVAVTLGRWTRELGPGLHLIWPFNLDHVIIDNVVPKTSNLKEQVLTTADGDTIVVGVIVRWRIKNIKKIALEVENADQVLVDTCYGQIGTAVAASTWEQIKAEQFETDLLKAMKKKAREWGIDVQSVQLTDRAKVRAFRLIGDSYYTMKGVSGE